MLDCSESTSYSRTQTETHTISFYTSCASYKYVSVCVFFYSERITYINNKRVRNRQRLCI